MSIEAVTAPAAHSQDAGKALTPERELQLRAAAQSLEATFLSEMLEHSGVAKPPDSFGGGPGEEAFSGFLADAYADELAKKGGIGLAETVFHALVSREQS